MLVRVAVLDMDDAKALRMIKKEINIPLVADIHFDYRLALEAINQGVDKIRLNPGNINNINHVKLIVNACNEKNICLLYTSFNNRNLRLFNNFNT